MIDWAVMSMLEKYLLNIDLCSCQFLKETSKYAMKMFISKSRFCKIFCKRLSAPVWVTDQYVCWRAVILLKWVWTFTPPSILLATQLYDSDQQSLKETVLPKTMTIPIGSANTPKAYIGHENYVKGGNSVTAFYTHKVSKNMQQHFCLLLTVSTGFF